MSQKYVKKQNTNSKSTAYGKYYAKAVYDENFVGIDEIADYIQQQASVKKSRDCRLHPAAGVGEEERREGCHRRTGRGTEALHGDGTEGAPGRHRHLQGGLLGHRRGQSRRLHRCHHHHT